MFNTPTYIVLDLPQAVGTAVTRIRAAFDPYEASLPPEITLAGSSGLGVLCCNQSPQIVFEQVGRIARACPPIKTAFASVDRFSGTQVYWLKPRDRKPFDLLHDALRVSGILFESSPFPFNPHCTITAKTELNTAQEIEVQTSEYPKEEFILDAISLYQLRDEQAVLMERFPLRGQKA